MFKKLKWGAAVLASTLLAGSLGLATPALAEETVPSGKAAESYLVKVIDAPHGTNASQDTYTFHFAGGGTVTKDSDGKLVSDGIEQNTTDNNTDASNYPDTIKEGDVVPVIADLNLKGKQLTDANTLQSGTVAQTTSRASLAYILGVNGETCADSIDSNRQTIEFPHAGVWTYRVTETSATRGIQDGTYITKSNASYLMRVYVKNVTNPDANPGSKKTEVASVTIEQEKKDEGTDIPADERKKVDPTYPKTDPNNPGKITSETPNDTADKTEPAGEDGRGRDVYGFTFANEYVKGNTLIVEKNVVGEYGDKDNKLFDVTLTIHDAAAPAGSCITYQVDKGDDITAGRKPLDGVANKSSSMVEFQGGGEPLVIEAKLQHGGTITVTGLYGIMKSDKTRTELTKGLKASTKYDVAEAAYADYTPAAYVQQTNAPSTKKAGASTTAAKGAGISVTNAEVGNDGGYVYIENTFDDSSVTPTGIIINNLPYVLMVGIPVAGFAVMFANKRRHADEIA
jgi:hypothetical protein